ncbi:MAG: M1 family metallopeptidase [Lachnospiraceae bacterium]|nr:M1 family metallopeptidase [Lachnospiraceae bacterium]
MKRMKHGIVLLLVCVLALALTACGKKSNQNEKKQATPTETATPDGRPATPSSEPPVTNVTATPTPTPLPTIAPWPAENCEIRFPDRELYHYDMDLRLNTADCTVGGHVAFAFYNDSKDSWNELCLRDYSSHFTDVKTAGYDPELYKTEINGAVTELSNVVDSRDNQSLTFTREEKDASVVWIKLSKPLAPGEKMTLSYDFTAKIPSVPDRYGYYEGVYNVTNFYPILAEYDQNGWSHESFINCGECFCSEVSNYDVRITVPSGFLVASTGTETGKESNGDAVTYTYYAPCVRDFVFSASDQFVKKEAVYDGIKVNLYYPSFMDADAYWVDGPFGNQMQHAANTTLKAAEDALAAFGEAFGKYPYEELDIIISRIDAGGMEYPNLIIITDQECHPVVTFDDMPGENLSPKFLSLETCVAHEIGHQWFMGIVGSNSGMEPWLDESITSYSECVFEEYRARLKDPDATVVAVDRLGRKVMDMGDVTQLKYMMERGMIPFNQSYYEFKSDNDYISAIYQNAQRALYQMEEILGRKEFHSVLREYVRRNAFTNSTTANFFEVLFEYAGKDNEELNRLIANTFDLERIK